MNTHKPKKIYLINPKTPCPGYFGAEVFGHFNFPPAIVIGDLTSVTVAALMSPYFDVTICDEHLTPVDFETDADFVALTGKITQWQRTKELAEAFRQRGKVVIIGGAYASLSHERVRPYCDILIRGEIDEVADGIFSEIAQGNWKDEYIGTVPDLANSPLPRWDLYPYHRIVAGAIQTSKGCPFLCEFCDVIQFLGRKQRHKPVARIIEELDRLYALGLRHTFIVDDNFTAHRRKAKEILAALKEWNEAREGHWMTFGTQLSLDAAKDDELLRMLAQAGLAIVYVGVETPNMESLKGAGKLQNVGFDLVERIQRFVENGMAVNAGMVIGFDNDTKEIFQAQYDFAMRIPVPIFTFGFLNAPDKTPLHDRMRKENRLIEDSSMASSGNPLGTNIIMKNMSQDEAHAGMKWLINNLYSPGAFGRRLINLLEHLGPIRYPFSLRDVKARKIYAEQFFMAHSVMKQMREQSNEDRAVWVDIHKILRQHPELSTIALNVLLIYSQSCYAYRHNGLWDQTLVGQPLVL